MPLPIRLAARLPKKSQENGLLAIVADFLRRPHDEVIAVVRLRTTKKTTDFESDDGAVPTIGIFDIEPILDEASAARVAEASRDAKDRRTGVRRLPFVDEASS
ncbi:hypothetical protein I6A60_01785 [Frankia sp. AgB1.9]|uniref:hypothetical protein n=1 Tax=unclassified Frankia TaxID=2632575 RepID=UPI001933CCB5|nr:MULTISPECIES: hypothetical protein [unclassified Frankia]MBL7491338.1 hypothetical protein [Frankia sp. AgW1.1]MBL7546616.1 hypothetical protein [Frankia sp. AgB1.9]MBL7622398.1 hypothetical protein [Frankia sp. AgB1.8]